ncbi:MAG: hypothetical protein SGJ11_13495 [Phycisphaerae bacterium]|nr:hypothetical protein [Phycisphaerae bacterium]
MSDDAPSDACTECGFARGATMRTKPRWWSLWRAIPLFIVCVLLSWMLWHDHKISVGRYTRSTDVYRQQTRPVILDSIPVALATVRQIAEGRADRAAADQFRAALVDALDHGLAPFYALPEPRGAFVSAGVDVEARPSSSASPD